MAQDGPQTGATRFDGFSLFLVLAGPALILAASSEATG
jgi:hypothetical protein